MTAEKYVKGIYPNARIEKYSSRGWNKSHHWICWSDFQSKNPIRLGLSKKSKDNAWVDAKNYLTEKFKP